MHRATVPDNQPIGGSAVTAIEGAQFVHPDLPDLVGVPLDVAFALTRHGTDSGTYYSVGGEVQAWPGRPVQPRAGVPLSTVADRRPQGQLLISATYSETTGYDPVITIPVTDVTLPEPNFFATGWFPGRLAVINSFGNQDRSSLIAGQFNASEATERLYNSMALETYYVDQSSTDNEGPVIWGFGSEIGASGVISFAVTVSDAQRVLITYALTNGDGTGELQSLELSLSPSGDPSLWIGSIAGLPATAEFFIQAIDDAGNVALGSKEHLHTVGAHRLDAIVPIYNEHTFIAVLAFDEGAGFVPQPNEVGTVTLTGVGEIVSETCSEGTDSEGKCQITLTSDVAGISTVNVTWVTELTTAATDFVAQWWDGSITLRQRVELGPFTSSGEFCFTLSRTDGEPPSTPITQCFTAVPGSTEYTYNWDGITKGTYELHASAPDPYPDPDPITNIVVDSDRQDFIVPTVDSKLPPQVCGNILDDFNRPGPELGDNWMGAVTVGKYRIVNNQAEVLGGGAALWNGTVPAGPAFGTNQEVCATLTKVDAKGHHNLLLKVQDGDVSQGAIGVFYDGASDRIGIEAYTKKSGWVSLTSVPAPAPVMDGDVLTGQAFEDGTVKVFINGGLIATADTVPDFDDLFTGGGNVGIWFSSPGHPHAIVDDFGGGDLP
jgi:hypothetical protein